jgi:hypothetical protein
MPTGDSEQVKVDAQVNKPDYLSSSEDCAVEGGVKACVVSAEPRSEPDGSIILAELKVSSEDSSKDYCKIELRRKRGGDYARIFITVSGYVGQGEWVINDPLKAFEKLLTILKAVIKVGGGPDGVPRPNGDIADLIREVMRRAYDKNFQPPPGYESLNDREVSDPPFTAKVVVPDENTVDITIRRSDRQDVPTARFRFALVREGFTRFRVGCTIYSIGSDGSLIEEKSFRNIHAQNLPDILNVVRAILRTNRQGLRAEGRIGALIEEVIRLVTDEAERRAKEAMRKILDKLYEQAINEPGLKEDPLKYIHDAISLLHAGDYGPITIAILAIVSSQLPEEYRINILFIAPSGRGKTNLLKLLRRITPKRWRLFAKLSLGSSPLALFYQALERRGFVLDMRNKIWFVNEPSWLILGQAEEDPGKRLMKQTISDTTDREAVCYDTVITINNTRKAVKLCLRGRPVIFATIQDKYSHKLDEQIVSRMLPVPLDPSRDVLGRIIYHIVYVKTDPATLREFRRRAALIRAFLARELPKVNEVIFTEGARAKIMKCSNLDNPSLCDGYIGRLLGVLETESVVTRATEALKALAASIALIKRRYEKKDGHVTLVVTGDDVDEAWNISKPIIESMAFGINPLYNQIKEAILEILRSGPARRKDIVDAIKQRYDVRRGWIDEILKTLVKFNVIEKCDKGIYAISCPKSSEITKYTNEDQEGQGEGNES